MKVLIRNLLISALALSLIAIRASAAEPKMPDTFGFSLGMSAQAVVQRMRQLSFTIYPGESNPGNVLDKPMLHSLAGVKQEPNSSLLENVTVDLVTPPGAQVVWRVVRKSDYPQNAKPTIATVVTSLREKYGPETWQDTYNNPSERFLRWLFDEQGNVLRGEAKAALARDCYGSWIVGVSISTFKNRSAQQEPCLQFVHLTVSVSAAQVPGVADRLEITLVNPPLAGRFFPATERWLSEQQAKALKRQVDKVQQQGVKPNL